VLQQFFRGAAIELGSDLATDLVELLIVRGSKELIQPLLSLEFCAVALNTGNAIYRLRRNALLQINRSAEVDFTSAHFCELRQHDLTAIEFDNLVRTFHRLPKVSDGSIRKLVHNLIIEKDDSYRVIEDILSLPDCSFQKGIECISDENEALRPTETMWRVPIDCSNVSLAKSPVAADPQPNPVRRPLIPKEKSDSISSFLKTARPGVRS
jgi:hypothetical protein